MQLFVDDNRAAPIGWVVARNYDEAIRMLEANWDRLTAVALDHDIASFRVDSDGNSQELTGYTIMCWIEQRCADAAARPTFDIFVHSQNSVGAVKILVVAERLALGSVYRVTPSYFY